MALFLVTLGDPYGHKPSHFPHFVFLFVFSYWVEIDFKFDRQVDRSKS